jgi:hypothetical protein
LITNPTSSPSTSTNANFGSLLGEDALRVMLLQQANNQSPTVSQQQIDGVTNCEFIYKKS